jgi:hypothetical protein
MFPALSAPYHFTAWTLRFRQFSFHHIVRALTGMQLGGFAASCLSRHAFFPSGFRVQVGLVAQGHCTQPLPCCTGIRLRRYVTHVTCVDTNAGRAGLTKDTPSHYGT